MSHTIVKFMKNDEYNIWYFIKFAAVSQCLIALFILLMAEVAFAVRYLQVILT